MIDWKIQSRAHGCQACARPFGEKQPYFTLLLDKKQVLERLDVCPACWEAQYSQGAHDRKGFLSFWQGVYTTPAPRAPDPIQKESAESLLRKLMELNEARYAPACFILAVMLERKRVLRVKAQTFQEGHRLLVYEHAKQGDIFNILDPDLQLQQLEEVQRLVADLLERGVPSDLDGVVTMESRPGGAESARPEAPQQDEGGGGKTAGWTGNDGVDPAEAGNAAAADEAPLEDGAGTPGSPTGSPAPAPSAG